MPEKSYVTLLQSMCPVCRAVTDTNELALDSMLRPRFEKHTVDRFALCEKCRKAVKDLKGVWLISALKDKKGLTLMGDAVGITEEGMKSTFGKLPKERFVFADPEVVKALLAQAPKKVPEYPHVNVAVKAS